jgi:hypothetical protein
MLLGIDHVLIAVQDVDHAIGDYRRLGFAVLRGGTHPRWGTHNALVPLADGSYFELIGVTDRMLALQSPFSRNVLQALERDNRLAGFALDSDDLDTDVAAIRKRGIQINDPEAGGRARPDGQHVEWRSARCKDDSLPFLIQDVTPRELRIPAPADGIGQGLRLAAVTMGAKDPDVEEKKYTKLVGTNASGRLNLPRGGIRFEKSERIGLLRVTLWAEQLEPIMEYWRTRDVSFDREEIKGRTLLAPRETSGAPIDMMIGNPNSN